MAALNTIAKDWGDELREGIAWVIIWKTGRSWNAQAVWLYDDTFELEDLELARKVLMEDPNAVMLNGYYCGHLGENMTTAELTSGIRWHYENGYNQLADSAAFPAEPTERSADLPQNMAWYGKTTTEGPDPYVFDGYMSPKDYELMHEQMAAESMELTLTIGPEQAAAIAETMRRAFDRALETVRKAADWLTEALRKAATAIRERAASFVDFMLYHANDHPKWWHLYKHAKKARTRKKYRRLLMTQLSTKLAAVT